MRKNPGIWSFRGVSFAREPGIQEHRPEIARNEAATLDHWNGLIDGAQLVQRLQPLPTSGSRPPPPHTQI
jgi:hypothetical protein